MHAVPASCRPGSGDLHLELDPFPAALKFQSIPAQEVIVQEHAEVLAEASSPPLMPPRHPGRIATTAATSSSEELCEKCEDSTMLNSFDQAFENTSTSVAASQMRNALTALADTVKDPHQKDVSLLWDRSRYWQANSAPAFQH